MDNWEDAHKITAFISGTRDMHSYLSKQEDHKMLVSSMERM